MNKIDYSHELNFWQKHLQKEDHFKSHLLKLLNPKKRRLVFPKILLNNLSRIMLGKRKIKVLDVGCGPTSGLAWAVDRNLFKVTGIDPLANEYTKIMKENCYAFPIIPKKGFGEKLTEKFGKKKFDFVYSRNSLDHTKSSIKTFK